MSIGPKKQQHESVNFYFYVFDRWYRRYRWYGIIRCVIRRVIRRIIRRIAESMTDVMKTKLDIVLLLLLLLFLSH